MSIILVIFTILLIHHNLNPQEKIYIAKLFKSDLPTWVLRPLPNCHIKHPISFDCLGMPSGHAEMTTIVSIILYYYNYNY